MRIKWFAVSLATTLLLFTMCFAAAATPTPVISGISPAQGFDNQQISLTISGEKFYSAKTTVKLTKAGQADIIATDVAVTKTSITCKVDLKGQAVGVWDVVVTNIGKITKKERFNALAGAFTIVSSAPTIKSISPFSAFDDDSITLTVKGTNFRPGATVSLVNNGKTIAAAKNTVAASGDLIEADFVFKTVTPEIYDVLVTNTDGSKAVLAAAFGIVETPVVAPDPEPVATEPVTTEPATTPAPVVSQTPADPNTLFKSVFFDFDKSEVRQDQLDILKANLDLVKNNPEGYIILGGHADERGPNNYNIRLSGKRAETIK
ncbi:MAG TPA: IPT/TIG domain-containing protein, partial [Bacillota bacterium]|nr:IPT/TIG domain-containing protein [Bacillota bacterium]